MGFASIPNGKWFWAGLASAAGVAKKHRGRGGVCSLTAYIAIHKNTPTRVQVIKPIIHVYVHTYDHARQLWLLPKLVGIIHQYV